MELAAWGLELGAWSLQLLSLLSCNNLDGARQKSLVFGVCNIFNGLVPAIPAALALAALIRRRACLAFSAYSTGPRPALTCCAVNLGC